MDKNFINRCLKKNKYQVLLYATLGIIVWFISFAIPYITGKYVDSLIYISSESVIYLFTALVLCINIFSIVGNYFQNLLGAKLNTKMVFDISFEIFEYLKRISLTFYKDIDSVYLVSKINDDSNVIINFILSNIISIIAEFLTFFLGIFIVYSISPFLSLIMISVIPIYIFIYIRYRKKVYDTSYAFKESQNKYFSSMTEQFIQIKYLKTHGLFDFFSQKLIKSFSNLFKEMLNNFNATYLLNNLNLIITFLINTFIIFYAGLQIIKGKMTIGSFTIINSYFTHIVASVSFFMALGSAYQEMNVSKNRINELINNNQENNGKNILKTIDTIDIKSLSFSYDKSRILFDNLTIQFKKGEIYCVKGTNGTGKSTFINTIIGLYQNDYSGKITYNNIKLEDLNMYDIRKNKIAISDQEPQLLNSSIIENLIMSNSKIDIKAIEYWCKKLGIYDKIISFKNSFHANIAENSLNLSGGEKQKISLARTFLKNAPFIILDEPTSALDLESIRILIGILEEIKKDKIIIIITHDEKLLCCADNIIDIDLYKYKERR